MDITLIPNAKVTVGRPPLLSSPDLVGEDWTSFSLRIHDFMSLSSANGHYIESPMYTCNGHEWKLQVFPGGSGNANGGNVSMIIQHRSEASTTADFAILITNKFGNVEKSKMLPNRLFSPFNKNWIWNNCISRSDILDESQEILDDNGTLTIIVSIKEDPTTVFVPKHPLLGMIKEMFNDEATADVCFEVGKCVEDEEKEGKQEKSDSLVSFHAHRSILKKCAPMLADLLGDNVKAAITDMSPEIFRHLLSHIYGGEVSSEELKTLAKDIIHAADKYAIVNLKLKAEAAYVESTGITFENAVDDLLYADSKNCALLKEKTLAFLAENHRQAAEKISFADFSPHLMVDLFDAISRVGKGDLSAGDADELATLCVSALRRKVYDLGLEVDGSREAMIDIIKNSSSSSQS